MIQQLSLAFVALLSVHNTGNGGSGGAGVSAFNLTVLHFNDFHARFEETNVHSGNCHQRDAEAGKCYGGLARLYQTIEDIRRRPENQNTIVLNGGDMYQGTIWYSVFKWKPMVQFMNKFKFTASALGNHEFDDSPDGLLPLAQKANFPLVCANCDFSEMPEFRNLVKPYHIANVGGKKIGIIGYLTPDTRNIASTGRMLLRDEIEAVRKYANQLKGEGVNIVIGLGHSGYEKDKEIAAEIPEVDLVIGGHSHTFLYGDKKRGGGLQQQQLPSRERPHGPYPTIVKQAKTGKKVLVVQAYAFTKYLGRMDLNFDDDGNITLFNGKPILLDSSLPQNEDILNDLNEWKLKLGDVQRQVVGESKVLLEGEGVRMRESTLGDFLTDAMLDYFRVKHLPSGDNPEYRVSIFNSGGLRSSIEAGNVTEGDVRTVLPFGSSYDSFVIKMRVLKQALQYSASRLSQDGSTGAGAFLQVGGMKYTIDLSKPINDRVVKVEVQHPDEPGLFVPLADETPILVISNNYIASGKDGYTMFEGDRMKQYTVGPLDVDVFEAYLKKKSPVTQQLDGRIKIINPQVVQDRTAAYGDDFASDDVISDRSNANDNGSSKTEALASASSKSFYLKRNELILVTTTALLVSWWCLL